MAEGNEEHLQLAITSVKDLMQKKKEKVKIVTLSGSGISKASGIPTFRGKDGLWRNYNAMDLATPQAFRRDPKLVWEWYSWRIGLILEKEPNLAHYALVKLQDEGLSEWVITQNVDSLHFRAGSKNLLEIHGNIFRARCEKCGEKVMLEQAPKEPPICHCGNMLRPDVVWFGESLDYNILAKAEEILTHHCDVLLVVGTSGIVYPAAGFPLIAKANGAIVLEFNIDYTPLSRIVDVTVLGKSEELLPKFVEGILAK